MPCLVVTGHPCVGKTEFAKKLGARALAHQSNLISSVMIVNEESICVDFTKSECYATSHVEKSTRSSLKAKVDRSLNDKTLVICDSLNYIKGYRYELHCLSKAAKQQHGVIWILNSEALNWNRQRQESAPATAFTEDQMKELMQRYEPPDKRNRWDKPLWRVDLSPKENNSTDQAAQDALQQSVYNMHELSEAMVAASATVAATVVVPPPIEELSSSSSEAVTTTEAASAAVVPEAAAAAPLTTTKSAASSFTKKGSGFKRVRPNNRLVPPEQAQAATNTTTTTATTVVATTTKEEEQKQQQQQQAEQPRKTVEEQIDDILDEFLLNVAPLKEGLSTKQQMNAQPNVLHEVDSVTLRVCNALMTAQAQNYGGSFLTLSTTLLFGDDDDEQPALQMACHRPMPLTELKRLRKQYVRWVTMNPPDDTSTRGLVESFVKYVEVQVNK
jgi:protein KTI12